MDIQTVNYNATGTALVINGTEEIAFNDPSPRGEELRAWIRNPINTVGPALLNVETARDGAAAKLRVTSSKVMGSILNNVGAEERDTWTVKEAAARAYLANPDLPPDPMLVIEAQINEETVADLCHLVVAMSDGYKQFAASIVGLRRKAEKDMWAATEVSQVNEILNNTVAAMLQAAESVGQ